MFAELDQKQKFQDRLGRVKAGGPNTTKQMYCGVVETAESKYSKRKKSGKKAVKAPRTGASLPVSLITGALIGVAAVILTRYLRFKLNGGAITGPNADLFMVADVVLAITIAIMLRAIFRFNSRAHGFGKFAGVAATVLLMHNVVHITPGPFVQVYSAAWVDQVVTSTKANSVLVAGVSYTFDELKLSQNITTAQLN